MIPEGLLPEMALKGEFRLDISVIVLSLVPQFYVDWI